LGVSLAGWVSDLARKSPFFTHPHKTPLRRSIMLISRNFALNHRFGHFSGNGSSRRKKALLKLNKIDAFLWPLSLLEFTGNENEQPETHAISTPFLAWVFFSEHKSRRAARFRRRCLISPFSFGSIIKNAPACFPFLCRCNARFEFTLRLLFCMPF
jgi:hypothetical protein